jgi:hypothetical protein
VDGVSSMRSRLHGESRAHVESRSSRSRADGGMVAREVVEVGAMTELMPSPGGEPGLGCAPVLGTQAVENSIPGGEWIVAKAVRSTDQRLFQEGRRDWTKFRG